MQQSSIVSKQLKISKNSVAKTLASELHVIESEDSLFWSELCITVEFLPGTWAPAWHFFRVYRLLLWPMTDL